MNARSLKPILFLYLFGLLSTANGQTTNPPYIAQFPTIDRVKAVIKGTDAIDTAARQVGAFWQLQVIVKELSGRRQYVNQLTPDEGRAIGQYRLGYHQGETQVPANLDKPGWNRAYSKYHYDDNLREEIFEKLLTPQIRAQWAQTTGDLDRKVKANQQARDRQIQAEGGPFQRASGSTQTAKTAVVGAADPSIAKAKAAKIDTSIVGFQLGEPIALPECDPLGFGAVVNASTNRATVRETCVYVGIDFGKALGVDPESIAKELFGVEVDKSDLPDVKTILLTDDRCPEWMKRCEAFATLHNGRLSGIALFTPGRGYEKEVTADLREKYGPASRMVNGTVTPETGNAFDINEPQWMLPGIYVEYEVVLRDEKAAGRVSATNQGVVRVMTESEQQRRLAKQKTRRKPKL